MTTRTLVAALLFSSTVFAQVPKKNESTKPTSQTRSKTFKYLREFDKTENKRCKRLYNMCWNPTLEACEECPRRDRIAKEVEKSPSPTGNESPADPGQPPQSSSTSGSLSR